jgi:glycosyltransferase involved in cell wall biosynthesis
VHKRIVLFTDTFCDANGVSRFLQDMSKEALESNKPFFIITSTKKTYVELRENNFIFNPLIRFKMPFFKELDIVFPPFFKMYKKAKELNPDIIHISTPGFVGICGVIIAKLLKKDIVGTYHTDFPQFIYKVTNNKIYFNISKWCLKIFYKNFKSLISRSNDYIEKIHQDIKYPKEKIHHLISGVNTEKFSPKFKDKTIWSNYGIATNHIFLYVGRVSKEKNLDFLIETFDDYSKMNTNVSLAIVGSGNIEEYKKRFTNEKIFYLGHKEKEELSSLYASSDAFVFPSVTDTLGQVVYESIASGTPVIVTNVGGPQTIVNQASGKVGFILESNNTKQWIETFDLLLTKKEKMKTMREDCEKFANENSISKSFESFYKLNCQNF